MSLILLLGIAGILVILGVFMTMGNKKDSVSRVVVVIGIALIVVIVFNYSTFNHLLLSWLSQYPFFRALIAAK